MLQLALHLGFPGGGMESVTGRVGGLYWVGMVLGLPWPELGWVGGGERVWGGQSGA